MRMISTLALVLVLLGAICAGFPVVAAETVSAPASPLPGGANALQETYEDWQVNCTQQAAVKRCSLLQQQADPKSRQRVLAIELNAAAADKASGVLVLPFGLALDSGISLQIDDTQPGLALRFRTCLPAGCLVPFAFDAKLLAALRKGTSLKVKAIADAGTETLFTVSLKGFVAAFDRTAGLTVR